MYLYLITQLLELSMDVFLLWLRFFTRPLELNQQRTTTGNPEYPVWVPCVARRLEFGADDPEVFPRQINGITFYLRFFHGSL
jgi:hypothetical protein